MSRKKNFRENLRINPLLTKLVRSSWLDIDLDRSFFASLWTSTQYRFINTQKKQLGQYPAILTEQLVNNPYISRRESKSTICLIQKRNFSKTKKDIPDFLFTLKNLSNKQQLFFYFIGT